MFFKSISCARLTVVVGLVLASSAAAQPTIASPEINDFHVMHANHAVDSQKYLTLGWNGWSTRTVHWRYNDTNRPSSIVASSDSAVDRLQTAMAKWSAVCNVKFVYDGTTTSAPSLATGSRDGVNVVAWGALPGNTTGFAYVGASAVQGQTFTLDEADMIINPEYNPVLDFTLLHEVGHMLGLKHSNQESSVMSGPNVAPDVSTAYSALETLQADDIAGCVSLYGLPESTLAQPIATTSVSALAFGNASAGSSIVGPSITLINSGNAPLAINYAVVSGKDFSLAATTCTSGTTLAAGASCVATLRFTPSDTGTRSGTITFGHNARPATTNVALAGTGIATQPSVRPTQTMVEYRYAPLDYYFVTSRETEKATLDNMTGFARTGATLLVYAQAQDGMRPITRFYFDRVALGRTRGSHFYTLLDSELQTLARQNPTGDKAAGLAQNEGIDSYAYAPLVSGPGGSCASGQVPVYRLFRGATHYPDNPNHRFTTSLSTYNSFVALGWDGEGVTFCTPSQ